MTPDNQLRRTPATTETHCQVKCILIQLTLGRMQTLRIDQFFRRSIAKNFDAARQKS